MDIAAWVWLAVVVAAGIFEAVTAGLVSIWFCAGGIAALIAAVLDAPAVWQLVIFTLVSALALLVTRPIVKKFKKTKPEPTNADRLIGKTAKVTQSIDNANSTGTVYADGKTWTARSASGENIADGSMVTIVKIEGVKLFVEQ